ncbi:MAG: hypothetical protein AAF598_06765 [Bacteroidota bacterium]
MKLLIIGGDGTIGKKVSAYFISKYDVLIGYDFRDPISRRLSL